MKQETILVSNWKAYSKDDYNLKIKTKNQDYFAKPIKSLVDIISILCSNKAIRRTYNPTSWVCIDIDQDFKYESIELFVKTLREEPAYIVPSSSYSLTLRYKLHLFYEIEEVSEANYKDFQLRFADSVLPHGIISDPKLSSYKQNIFGCNKLFSKPLYIGTGYSEPIIEEQIEEKLQEYVSQNEYKIPCYSKKFRKELNVEYYNGFHFSPNLRYKNKVSIGQRHDWVNVNCKKLVGLVLSINKRLGVEKYTLDNIINQAKQLLRNHCIITASENITKMYSNIIAYTTKFYDEVKLLDIDSLEFATKCLADKSKDGSFKLFSKDKDYKERLILNVLDDNSFINIETNELTISTEELLSIVNLDQEIDQLKINHRILTRVLDKYKIIYSRKQHKQHSNKIILTNEDYLMKTNDLVLKYNCSRKTICKLKQEFKKV